MKEITPKLFFGIGEENREAIHELLKNGVPCDFVGPIAEERTPLLVYGSISIYGLDGIQKFIRRWKSNTTYW